MTGEKVVVEMLGLVVGLDDDNAVTIELLFDAVFIEFNERLD